MERLVFHSPTGFLISALPLALLAGCFEGLAPTQLNCTEDRYCPAGYVCVGTQPGAPGRCRKPADAARPDISLAADGLPPADIAPHADTRPSTDAAPHLDLPAVPFDAGPDGHQVGSGGSIDRPFDALTGGTAGTSQTGSGGAGGTTSGGFGGASPPDAPPTDGGGDATLDAPASHPPDASLDAPPGDDGARLPDGTACTSDLLCESRLCIDGVCCGTTCPGQCQSCATGTCLPTETPRSPCGGTGVCAGRCDGNSPGCVFPDASTTCSQPGCRDSKTLQLPGACNGKGSCAAGGTKACEFVCAADTCSGVCAPTTLRCLSAGIRQQCSVHGEWQDAPCPNNQTCSGVGICGCPSGMTDCGSSGCVNVNGNDPAHCGSCTNACATNEACSLGTCECAIGTAKPCGTCLSWDFESTSSPSPWLIDWSPQAFPGTNGATNLQIAHSQAHGGASSLGVSVFVDYTNTYTAEVAVPACSSGGSVVLAGYTFSAHLLFSGPQFSSWADAVFLETWGPAGLGDSYPLVMGAASIPIGSWFPVSHQFTSGVAVNRIGIRTGSNDGWRGTMFIDDVVITGL